MIPKSHPLFEAYPLDGEQEISMGRVPTPYHSYDGHGLFIGGTANLSLVKELLQTENLYPFQTTDGQAIMGIWVVDFSEASLGAHHELQFSILVGHEATPAIESHSLTLLKALFTNSQARMFCYRLWNNTETVVAYNRELLGLNAKLNRGFIRYENAQKTFHFVDEAEQLIFEGHIHVDKATAPKTGWQMFRLLGLGNTLKAFSQPYLGAKVVNPISDDFPYNGDAQSYVSSDTPVVQLFDATTDSINIAHPILADVDFQPQFVEHFEPFRFVYLQPE